MSLTDQLQVLSIATGPVGCLLNFNNLKHIWSHFKRVISVNRVYRFHYTPAVHFPILPVRTLPAHKVSDRRHLLTWSDTEDLVKVSTDAHLLVELRGLGQVGTGFEIGNREDVRSTFAGS